MFSYEDRLRAVRLYIELGKRVGLTIRQLGYPTENARKSWHREYEKCHADDCRTGTIPLKIMTLHGHTDPTPFHCGSTLSDTSRFCGSASQRSCSRRAQAGAHLHREASPAQAVPRGRDRRPSRPAPPGRRR